MLLSVQTHKIFYKYKQTYLSRFIKSTDISPIEHPRLKKKMNGWLVIWSRQLPQGFSSTKGLDLILWPPPKLLYKRLPFPLPRRKENKAKGRKQH
jgi:hypothetical protein